MSKNKPGRPTMEPATLVNHAMLPAHVQYGTRKGLEDAGVVFGDIVANNELFVHATLPPGWRVVRSNHPLWHDLIDANGNKRASIFDKRDVFDRRAYLAVATRFAVQQGYELEGAVDAYVTDTGMRIYTTAAYPYTEGDEASVYQAFAAAKAEAEAWLDAHWPDWRDASAYWQDAAGYWS